MGYHNICELILDFEEKENINELLEKLKNIANPISDNIEIYTGYEFESDKKIHEVCLSDTYVKLGDYKEWIPIIANTKGLTNGLMNVAGDDPYDLWRVEFIGNGKYLVYNGVVDYLETDLGHI